MKTQNSTTNISPQTTVASSTAPIKTIRLGRIKAVIWENEADQHKAHNVTFARTYMDERKQFHDTSSFGKDDLLLLAKLAGEAHSFIYARRAELKNEE
jgi:hypothetical protein